MSKFLNTYQSLNNIFLVKEFFQEKGVIKQYNKGDFFVKEGEFSSSLGFIQIGSFHYKRLNSKREDQIVGFSFEDDFVGAYDTFQNQSFSKVSVQAIIDSTVFILNHDELNSFYEKHKTINLRAKISEMLFEDVYNRMLAFYCNTPEDRYLELLEKYPAILQYVSLKEIASFINIKPETLSRIRRKIVK